MTLYHVSSDGSPRPCTAKAGNCPVLGPDGSSAVHGEFHSINDALKFAELTTVQHFGGSFNEEELARDELEIRSNWTSEEMDEINEHFSATEEHTFNELEAGVDITQKFTPTIPKVIQWYDRAKILKTEQSLNKPDVDFGFEWEVDGSPTSARISLSKWIDEPTGTLYAENNGKIAILARDIALEDANTIWYSILEDHAARRSDLSIAEFHRRLNESF